MIDADPPLPYLADRTAVAAATDLIVRYGVHAGLAAAAEAEKSRDVGNHIHFCHWRQIGRLVEFLAAGRATGTVH